MRRAKPITYGRKTRLLSLTGNQFRADTYDIPSDDDEREERSDALLDAVNGKEQHVAREDSPLSDAGSDEYTSEDGSATRSRHFSSVPSKMDFLCDASHNEPLNRIRTAERSGGAAHLPAKRVGQLIQKERSDSRSDGSRKTSNGTIVEHKTGLPVHHGAKHATTRQDRRLPEPGKLICVASPAQLEDIFADPQSSPQGVVTQDPISDSSSMQLHDPLSSPLTVGPGQKQGKTPLSAIRRRLSTPRSRHKVVKREKRKPRPLCWATTPDSRLSGDGFEGSELMITYRHKIRKLPRARKTPKSLMFASLQIQAGPLPDVCFDNLDEEPLQDQEVGPPVRPSSLQSIKEEVKSSASMTTTQRSRRQVSFSDREDIIMAQLSSVSAPQMEVDSDVEIEQEDGEGEDEDQDEDLAEDEVVEDHHGDDDSGDDNSESEHVGEPPDTDRPRKVTIHNDYEAPYGSDDEHESSPPSGPTRPAKLNRLRRPDLDEFIEDDLDQEDAASFRSAAPPGTLPRPSTLGNRRLMEVREPIEDILSVKPTAQESRNDFLSSGSGDIFASSSHPHPPKRLRSILKNNTSTPDTAPPNISLEHTAANTRRNSQRATRTELNPSSSDNEEASNYFASASQSLNDLTPHASQSLRAINPRRRRSHHTIVPRRRQSSYFPAQHQPSNIVEVLDSQRAVPETSQMPGYTNACQLGSGVLKRHPHDATWTSSHEPSSTRTSTSQEAPKDLRMLTRNVSKEFGTLSQSVRRRPSLRFSSPMKVR